MKLQYVELHIHVFFEQLSFTKKKTDIELDKRTHGVQTLIWMNYQTSIGPNPNI